jgi:hypothetical protein
VDEIIDDGAGLALELQFTMNRCLFIWEIRHGAAKSAVLAATQAHLCVSCIMKGEVCSKHLAGEPAGKFMLSRMGENIWPAAYLLKS